MSLESMDRYLSMNSINSPVYLAAGPEERPQAISCLANAGISILNDQPTDLQQFVDVTPERMILILPQTLLNVLCTETILCTLLRASKVEDYLPFLQKVAENSTYVDG